MLYIYRAAFWGCEWSPACDPCAAAGGHTGTEGVGQNIRNTEGDSHKAWTIAVLFRKKRGKYCMFIEISKFTMLV